MLEGKPRESLVLYDTPIEVSVCPLFYLVSPINLLIYIDCGGCGPKRSFQEDLWM